MELQVPGMPRTAVPERYCLCRVQEFGVQVKEEDVCEVVCM